MTDKTIYPQENIDDFDDLTRFADENFDTNEVDLFQFSGDESSPFTRLKSVILSLEWEITDDYLQDLADELAELIPDWEDNKAVGVYLQGMSKIGKYLRLRGAYAHPNSIKLLLTFFHHLETIVSSPDMNEERITTLLRSDVRKFKVLQYQIRLAEEAAAAEGEDSAAVGTGLNVVARDIGEAEGALRGFKAAILELDWEVSDNSLAKFATALHILGEERIQNKSALILIQGMQALGQYIADERAKAHPESFNLLLSFHDGLMQLLDEGPSAPTPQQKKKILVNKVNRLNFLKKLIAPKDADVPPAIPLPQEVSPQTPPTSAASAEFHDDAELRDQAADALLAESNAAPDGIGDSESMLPKDEELLAEVEAVAEAAPAGEGPMPEPTPFAEDFPIELATEEPVSTGEEGGIEAEIDALFSMGPKRAMLSSEEEYPEEELPSSAYQAVDDELADGFIDGSVGARGGITPALADIVEESGFNGRDEQLDPDTKVDLDERLNFFFGDSDEETKQTEPTLSLFDEESDKNDEMPALAETADDSATVVEDDMTILFADSEEEKSLGQPVQTWEEETAFPGMAAGKTGGEASEETDPFELSLSLFDEETDSNGETPALKNAADTSPAALQDDMAILFAGSDEDKPLAEPAQTWEDEASELLAGADDEASVFAEEPAASATPAILEQHEESAVFATPDTPGEPVSALAGIALPEEETSLQADNEDSELQAKLDSFFDLPDKDVEPTAAEFEQLAVVPERDPKDEEDDLEEEQDDVLRQGALADVDVPAGRSVKEEEADPEIAQLLDSFLDDVDAPAPVPEAPPVPSAMPEVAIQPAEEPVSEWSGEDTVEAEAPLPAEEPVAELDLFALENAPPAQATVEPEAAIAAEELRLERSVVSAAEAAGATGGFEDILDSAEVQDFLLHGREMEEVADEELLFAENETTAVAPSEASSSVADIQSQEVVADPVETAAEELLDTEDAYVDLEDSGGEELFAGEDEAYDALLTDTVLEEAEAAAAMPEPSLFAEETETLDDSAAIHAAQAREDDPAEEAMLALGAALPQLLSSPSAEALAGAERSLRQLRHTASLSPVQLAAISMLETVVTGLGRRSATGSDDATVVDQLYQALVYPQDHLPVEAVSAFAQWMQNLLSDAGTVETPQEHFTTRDIYQELSGFRARMEEELAQLRSEMRKR